RRLLFSKGSRLMNTTYDVASAALTKLTELLPEWLELERRQRERDREIESWEKWPQGFRPWAHGQDYDKNRLGDLYKERRYLISVSDAHSRVERAAVSCRGARKAGTAKVLPAPTRCSIGIARGLS